MRLDYKDITTKEEYDDYMWRTQKPDRQEESDRQEKPDRQEESDRQEKPDRQEESEKQEIARRRKNAYKEACENRRFEIEMYWKRATYFWAFIVSIYTALFFVQKESGGIPHVREISLALSFLGFVFCLGFHFANAGAKIWQENWEQHVNLLEDEVAGSLQKIFMASDAPYSVSKINSFLSLVLCFFSGGFFAVAAVDFVKNLFGGTITQKPQQIWLFLIVVVFTVLVFAYMRFCLFGNQSGDKDFTFKRAFVEK